MVSGVRVGGGSTRWEGGSGRGGETKGETVVRIRRFWTSRVSISVPLACKASTLPIELQARWDPPPAPFPHINLKPILKPNHHPHTLHPLKHTPHPHPALSFSTLTPTEEGSLLRPVISPTPVCILPMLKPAPRPVCFAHPVFGLRETGFVPDMPFPFLCLPHMPAD